MEVIKEPFNERCNYCNKDIGAGEIRLVEYVTTSFFNDDGVEEPDSDREVRCVACATKEILNRMDELKALLKALGYSDVLLKG